MKGRAKRFAKLFGSIFAILIMVFSMLPVTVFADNGYGRGGSGNIGGVARAYNHIDVRVDGSFTLDKKINGVSVEGYPKTINVRVSDVTAEVTTNGRTVTYTNFKEKTGSGKEHEWRCSDLELSADSTVKITCSVATSNLGDGVVSWNLTKNYTKADVQKAIKNCPDHSGFDFDISGEDVKDTITHKVVFYTIDQAKGKLDTSKVQVCYEDVVHGSAFPSTPATNATTGYEFDAWYQTDGVVTTIPSTASKVTTFPQYVTKDLYYAANWKQEQVTVDVQKIWENLPTDYSPIDITVQLLANGDAVEKQMVTLNAQNNWTASFTGLNKYDSNGNEITYTVEELEILPAFSKKTEQASGKLSFTITNTANWGEDIIVDTATLRVNKVDYSSGEPLQGAKFSLEKINEDGSGTPITATTGADGYAIFDNLDEGNYRLKEVEAPDGYLPSDETWEFTVQKGDQPVGWELGDYGMSFRNKYELVISGDLDYGSDDTVTVTNEKIESVDIPIKKIVKTEEGTANGKFTFKLTQSSQALAKSNSEIYFKVLLDGKELKANSDGTYSFDINASSDKAGEGVLTMKSNMIPALRITICEESDSDANWKYDIEERVLVFEPKGDDQGYTIFREIKNGDDYDFEGISSLEFVNEYVGKEEPTPTPIKTGDDTNMAAWITISLATLAGLTVVLAYKKTRKR